MGESVACTDRTGVCATSAPVADDGAGNGTGIAGPLAGRRANPGSAMWWLVMIGGLLIGLV